jgi:hypothetical protein
LITQTIFGEEYKAPRYVVFSTPPLPRPLRPKCSPQHPILKHPQPTFLPQCDRVVFSDMVRVCTTSLDTTYPSTIFYRLLLNWASLRRH